MQILITLVLAIISAILYRMGGAAGYPKLWRRLGCMFCACIWMLIFVKAHWWIHLISAGVLYGALTTYWDELFGFDNHWFHGFAIGLAFLPFLLVIPWWLILVRAVVCGIVIGGWSVFNKNAVVEELGRGALIILTLPILWLA